MKTYLILSLCFSVTVSSKVYNAVTYDTLREPLKQLYVLYIQSDILIGKRHADSMDKERDNYKRRDKHKAVCRQIQKIARGLQKIIPDAVKIIEKDFIILSTDGNSKCYDIEILKEELEKSLGKMPSDIEKLFPTLNTYNLIILQEDEDFSYVEWIRQQRKKVEDNNVTYDTLREPLKQLYNLYPELDSRLEAWVNAIYALSNARKREKKDEIIEATKRQLEACRQLEAISRQILKIAKELHEIVPNAVIIMEAIYGYIPQRGVQISLQTTIFILSQELEIVLGKMPKDIEKLFSTLNNFQYRPLFFWELRQEHENLIQSELAKIGFPKESDLLVIGPFDNTDNKGKISPYPPETEDLTPGPSPSTERREAATYQGSPSPPSPLPKGEGRRAVRWQKADDGKMDGVLDFTKIFTPTLPSPKAFGEGPGVRWVLAYALINVISPDDRKAFLRIGSDDGVKVWLNGQVVWTNQVPRPLRFDEDVVPIELKQGNNRLLFKVDQGTGAWGLLVRITDETGQAIEGLRYQTPK